MVDSAIQIGRFSLATSDLVWLSLGAAGIGFSKSGFSGVSMVHVIVFAFVFGARESTGILLPMLIVGDLLAVKFFGHHVQWKQVARLMPPAVIGVILGTSLMTVMDESIFKPMVGTIVMALTCIQILRLWNPKCFEHVPHSRWFVWTIGILAGITTMIANAAGPVIAIYLLAISLPKYEFVGTSAWFFLTLNTFKVPFSLALGLIDWSSVLLNGLLAPCILAGMLIGRVCVQRVPQKWFDGLLLVFTAIASLKLMGLFG